MDRPLAFPQNGTGSLGFLSVVSYAHSGAAGAGGRIRDGRAAGAQRRCVRSIYVTVCAKIGLSSSVPSVLFPQSLVLIAVAVLVALFGVGGRICFARVRMLANGLRTTCKPAQFSVESRVSFVGHSWFAERLQAVTATAAQCASSRPVSALVLHHEVARL